MFCALVLATVLADLIQPPAGTAAPVIERYSLDNGVRIISLHVPGAEKQCTFTFLPLSLATDPAGKAQWSHLVEHMMIRSTDAEGLIARGVEFNGETGPDSMRLDTYAEPESFRESIEKHAKWLSARAIDDASLLREKNVIVMEETTVAQNLFTHKFAVAAWNQIVRHGRDHAAVHDDVWLARAGDIQTHMEEVLPLDRSVTIATIGPIESDQVRAALTELIGSLPRHEAGDGPTAAELRSGSIEATWDLPVRHLILWWRFADTSAASRALALSTEMTVMQTPPGPGGGPVLAQSLFHLPEGPVVLVNAALTPEQDPEAEAARLTNLVNSAAAAQENMIMLAGMFARELGVVPEFDDYRDNLQPRQRAFLEGQWLLGLARYEIVWGMSSEEIAAALRAVDADDIAVAARPLSGAPAGTLLLSPRE